jgi:hypothetical protein
MRRYAAWRSRENVIVLLSQKVAGSGIENQLLEAVPTVA